MGLGDWWNENIAGQMTDEQYQRLPQVQGPDASAYQIAGLGDYQNQLGGLGGQFGQIGQDASQRFGQLGQTAGGLTGLTADARARQEALQNYLQAVAMGQAPSAADQMLQNQQAQLASQQQSQMLSAGGMNPALAMRQLFQNQQAQASALAGTGAAQRRQEQQAFAGMAQQGNQQAVQNQLNVGQQEFANRMQAAEREFGARQQAAMAQSDIANNIFNSNRAQTSYNMEFQNDRRAFEMFQRSQEMQRQQDLARNRARLGQAIIGGGLTAAGGAVGSMFGPAGTLIGAQMGGSLAGGLTGSGGGSTGMDPALLAALMQNRSSPEPFAFDNGMTGSDINAAEGYGTFREPLAGQRGVYGK